MRSDSRQLTVAGGQKRPCSTLRVATRTSRPAQVSGGGLVFAWNFPTSLRTTVPPNAAQYRSLPRRRLTSSGVFSGAVEEQGNDDPLALILIWPPLAPRLTTTLRTPPAPPASST